VSVVLVVVLAGVFGFGAWVVRRRGFRVSTVPVFFAVTLPTLFVVYVALGLIEHALGN
jgi:hypothetical protein